MSKDPGPDLIIETDGAARGNPGPAGIGVVLRYPDGSLLARVGRGIGIATNNVAEYRAVITGLKMAADAGARRVRVLSDSKLLVEQLSGRYRVKAQNLRPLFDRAAKLAAGFESAAFKHVSRAKNAEADRLANKGIDQWLAGERRPGGWREPEDVEPGQQTLVIEPDDGPRRNRR